MSDWYRTAVYKVHFDMHTPEDVTNVGRDFDADAFAAALVAAGAEAVCFFSRCTYAWSYYPTMVGAPHPHLTRDLFGEGVAAMKAAGLRVIAYYAIDNLPAPIAAAHPDWLNRDPDQRPRAGHGSGSLACIFSRFAEDHLIPQMVEIAERYPVDGFFWDGVYQYFSAPSYSEAARAAFGRAIPTAQDDPNWRAYWHCLLERVHAVVDAASDAIGAARPGCLLGINWLASQRWSVPPPRGVGYLTGDPPMHNYSLDALFHLACWAWRDLPADTMTQRMLHSWQDFTCRTPETILTDHATNLACGGTLFIGDLLRPADVRPDPEVLKLIGRGFREVAPVRHALAGTRPAADVAILSSPETLRVRGGSPWVDDAPQRGALLALTEAGLTAHVLYDDDLAEHLDRYRCLIVPEQAYVGRASVAAIEAFVAGGGGLVVTGAIPAAVAPTEPTATADRRPFETLCGLQWLGAHPYDRGYLQLRGTAGEDLWRAGDDFRPPIPVPGEVADVSLAGAELLVPLTAPGGTYQIGARPPGETLDSPAITVHSHGRGRVAWCGLALAADVHRRGNPGAKYVLQGLVRRVMGPPTVERLGPPCVQVSLAQGDGRSVVALVAYLPDRRIGAPQVVESPPAVSGVEVRLRDGRTPWAVRCGGVPLPVHRDGETWRITIPPFTITTAVEIEW